MDAHELLPRARKQAGLSQRALAATAGMSRSSVSAYEAGRESPTLRQLDRLLAACGLQVRGTLEPLLADVDARVDAMVRGPVKVDRSGLVRLAGSLASAGVRWAVDGPTALGLHGLAVEHQHQHLCVAVVHDQALQLWLRDTMAKGYDPVAQRAYWDSWLGADVTTMRRYLSPGTFTTAGFITARVVDELPPLVRLTVVADGEGSTGEASVPALAVHDVEAAHPALAETLARWRERRAELGAAGSGGLAAGGEASGGEAGAAA